MSAIQLSSIEYYSKAREALQKAHPQLNPFAIPDVEKVVINCGVGRFEKAQHEKIAEHLEKLSGQKPKLIKARKSIASFKLRQGETNGYQVTLRRDKVKDFLLHLIYLALPRTRDFRGIPAKSWDKNMKTYTLGIPNASIFPVIGFDIPFQFGIQVSVVFKNPSEYNQELLQALKFPFQKESK